MTLQKGREKYCVKTIFGILIKEEIMEMSEKQEGYKIPEVDDTVFMIDGIKCEILPRENKRTSPVPIGKFAIVADMDIDGVSHEYAESFNNDIPIDVVKMRFIINVVQARRKAIWKQQKEKK
jgi:hypothetical protein